MKIKVLTIKEPWATLILNGKKTIETRTWNTKYRGEIYLHASATPISEISGKIFAKAKLVDVRKMVKEDEKLACCDIYEAYSWVLEDIKAIRNIPVKGKLGIWEMSV